MRHTPFTLSSPGAALLTRARHRLSFLYLEKCRIERDDNGVHATITINRDAEDEQTLTTYLPIADLTVLLLGPGTSITQPAIGHCARNGCGLSFVGSGGVRSYGALLSPYASTTLLERQASLWADSDSRVRVAQDMFLRRFPDTAANMLANQSIEQLRGLEGARVKRAYRRLANQHGIPRWRRVREANDPHFDSVNLAMNVANTALYGLAAAVVQVLGMSPGLGFVHTGNRLAFALDIADLYKVDHLTPLCFSLKGEPNTEFAVMAALREQFRLLRLLPRMVDDIHALMGLDDDDDPDGWEINELSLWAQSGVVEAGHNYGRHLRIPT